MTLEAACRQCDRADQLSAAAASGDVGALRHDRDAALAMVQFLSALRLPNAARKRAQLRSIRGVHQSPVKSPSMGDEARRDLGLKPASEQQAFPTQAAAGTGGSMAVFVIGRRLWDWRTSPPAESHHGRRL